MTLDTQLLSQMYYHMVRIRRFEEVAEDLYKRNILPGLLHPYIGEEAIAAGACLALNDDDYITSTHRGHGHLLAKGGDARRLLAEVCGRATGYCHGKGGSMHAADLSLGILGANGVVGGGLGIVTGAALSAKKRGTQQVALAFFGDGAANQGLLMEVMNMAAIWTLPVIYLCENNSFGEYTRMEEATVTSRPIHARAAAFGIPTIEVDGNDVIAVFEAVTEAVERARSAGGPTFIEAHTYRLHGHHMGDVGDLRGYRSREEIAGRWEHEPVKRFRDRLMEDGTLALSELEDIDAKVEAELQEALDFLDKSPMPDPSELMEGLYV